MAYTPPFVLGQLLTAADLNNFALAPLVVVDPLTSIKGIAQAVRKGVDDDGHGIWEWQIVDLV